MDAMQEQYGSEDDEEGEFEQDEEDLMMENDDDDKEAEPVKATKKIVFKRDMTELFPCLKEGKAVVTHKKLKRDEVKIVSRLIKKYG
eukprot:CAMPEP_0176367722 /NCGR_PEP_ID=MMETSP0126-20121128/22086_1 /TAXON_ID=141414 ORGANISM="Strombidinopsis acuminatum, Strain SPMC142" /NCGR_SAMPLE_ID=MMETSP0126 /ASSEMBLY_ACC=CAM_ASM_000229 /LENGTH=86 /DNA_ID=CAMNT_0017725671 /DNA_START=280 /DNA_END=540 /DNA_ORIENTATION=+